VELDRPAPDVEFLSAIAELWSAHPGTYKVADEAEDLIAALAQVSIKSLAAEVRESVPPADQAERIEGQLILPGGLVSPLLFETLPTRWCTALRSESSSKTETSACTLLTALTK
jgi:hypothetical protein